MLVEHRLEKVRTAAPNKMGSDTFIMVAFM